MNALLNIIMAAIIPALNVDSESKLSAVAVSSASMRPWAPGGNWAG